MKVAKIKKQKGKIEKKNKISRPLALEKKEIVAEKKPERQSRSEEVPRIKIKVIGIGGGAGSIVADIAANYKGASFLVADTDNFALAKLEKTKGLKTLPFGNDLTRGMGTGMNTVLGRRAAEANRASVEKALEGYDLVIFISCLGGGTGSGALPFFAQIAKEKKIVSAGIFTLPFSFEREKKLEVAKKSLKELELLLNAITIIPNERIFRVIDKKVPLKNALSIINRALGFSLAGLIEMIYNPGMINIDFADLKTILTGREPLAYLTRVESRERANVKELMEKILHNPLYPYDISRASRILFNISGPSDLSLSEVSEISQAIAQTTDRRAKVIFGVESTGKNNSLDITLLAVGCEMKNIFTGEEREEEKEEKKPLPKPEKKLIKKVVEEKIIPLLPSTKTVFKRQPVKKAKKTLKERELRTEEKKKIRKEARPLIPQKLKSMAKRGMRRGKERKNALQIQREMRENEQELLEKEEMWETPAFLRVGKQPEEKS